MHTSTLSLYALGFGSEWDDDANCRMFLAHDSICCGAVPRKLRFLAICWIQLGEVETTVLDEPRPWECEHSDDLPHRHNGVFRATNLRTTRRMAARWLSRVVRAVESTMARSMAVDARPRRRPPSRRKTKATAPVVKPKPSHVVLREGMTLRTLAQAMQISIGALESTLEGVGETLASHEEVVPIDTAELVALEMGYRAQVQRAASKMGQGNVQPRPPVVTVMGHVDHGKTTLLDALRKTSVAAKEAGGITQHIGAFVVQMPTKKASMTFLDTPGHSAFSMMRARGAAITDIVVLVVAGDDGFMPQTKEALAHAQAAGVPVVVAITKCDAPGSNPQKVKQELLANGVMIEEFGGEIQCIEVSALTGTGLVELEEAIVLQSEILELCARQEGDVEAVVIESRLDKGQGPLASVVIKEGTLKNGSFVVAGTEWGRIKSMKDGFGAKILAALPATPVELCGLRGVPSAGDVLSVVSNESRARRISAARKLRMEDNRLGKLERQAGSSALQLEGKSNKGSEEAETERELRLVLKADVNGTCEAIRDAIERLGSDKMPVKVLFSGVGPVTSSDIMLAAASNAQVLAFNTKIGKDTEIEAKQAGVSIHKSRIIYHLLDEVGRLLEKQAPTQKVEQINGEAEVLTTFDIKGKKGEKEKVAGCRVSTGTISNLEGAFFRVIREGDVVHEGRCASIRRHKLEVDRVGEGTECGVMLEGWTDFRQGDRLRCLEVVVQPAKMVKVEGGGMRFATE